MSGHYTDGRRWSYISKAWIFVDSWNDREEIARLEAKLRQVEQERDTAIRALHHHGYKQSCDSPACNCGDQWLHGGYAEERLRAIGEVLPFVNGATILQRVKQVLEERDKYRSLLVSQCELQERLDRVEQERDQLRAAHNELLFAVERKFPGETRHQTALRYIRQAEQQATTVEAQRALEGKEESRGVE